MTITSFFLRIIRRFDFLLEYFQSVIRNKVAVKKSRIKLNAWYNQLNYDEKTVFSNMVSKIFTKEKKEIDEGEWMVDFRGRQLRLPLRNEHSWLDWDTAISILGHDAEIKSTYESLLDHKQVNVFFDVGTNYGTHSLLFLTVGIPTVSFEPNKGLKQQFDLLCKLNGVEGKTESFAVGDKPGVVDLWFPEKDPWLGTVNREAVDALNKSYTLHQISVPIITLDEYAHKTGVKPDLIKIDTEGNELNVMQGAVTLIEETQPAIIFESRLSENPGEREGLWTILEGLKYTIHRLPFGQKKDKQLSRDGFLASQEFNFIALPVDFPYANE